MRSPLTRMRSGRACDSQGCRGCLGTQGPGRLVGSWTGGAWSTSECPKERAVPEGSARTSGNAGSTRLFSPVCHAPSGERPIDSTVPGGRLRISSLMLVVSRFAAFLS